MDIDKIQDNIGIIILRIANIFFMFGVSLVGLGFLMLPFYILFEISSEPAALVCLIGIAIIIGGAGTFGAWGMLFRCVLGGTYLENVFDNIWDKLT